MRAHRCRTDTQRAGTYHLTRISRTRQHVCWLALVLTVQSIAQCVGTHSLPRARQLDPCIEWTEDEARGIGLSIDEVGTRGPRHVFDEARNLASLAVVATRPSNHSY